MIKEQIFIVVMRFGLRKTLAEREGGCMGKNDRHFTTVDLFSGSGGLSEGFARAGFRIVLAIDNNRHAAETYSFNHKSRGTKFLCRDIIDVASDDVLDAVFDKGHEGVDVVVGGPPCKGFSAANMRSRSVDNPANSLPHHFLRFIKDLQPEYFVMENVPGLLTLAKGEVKERFLKECKKIGYNVGYSVLNSMYYGVPQKRERVFFLGIKGSGAISFPEYSHLSPGQAVMFGKARHILVSDALSDLPSIGDGGGGENECAYSSNPKTEYQRIMRKGKSSADSRLHNHVCTKNSEIVVERFKKISPGGNWRDIPEDLLKINGEYERLDRTHAHIYKRLHPKELAPTIANFRKAMLQHPFENRIISVREAARLQSFPDAYVFKGGISAMQQQVADAVPVFFAEAIAKQIITLLRTRKKVGKK